MSIAGIISGSVVGLIAAGGIAFGTVQVVSAANAPEPEVVQVADFSTESYDPATVLTAHAEKAERDRIEAERIAAEKAAAEEAARLAAEQAAAEEAARIAAEEAATWEEPVTWDEPAPEPDPEPANSGIPAVWVDLGNGTGYWDFSHCPTGSGTTGADGNVYCS